MTAFALAMPQSKQEVVDLLAKTDYHFVMTFANDWHFANGNSPSFVRVYKASLRELAGNAIENGFSVRVATTKDNHMIWVCKRKAETNE